MSRRKGCWGLDPGCPGQDKRGAAWVGANVVIILRRLEKAGGLVSWGCRDTFPQTMGLTATEIILSQSWRPEA